MIPDIYKSPQFVQQFFIKFNLYLNNFKTTIKTV